MYYTTIVASEHLCQGQGVGEGVVVGGVSELPGQGGQGEGAQRGDEVHRVHQPQQHQQPRYHVHFEIFFFLI